MRVSGMISLFLVVLACGGGGDGPPTGNDNPVNTVTINGAGSASLEIDESRSLSVTLRDVNNAVLSGRAVAWTATPAGRVSLSSATGTQTTVEGVALGQVTVTATSEGKSGTVNYTVVDAAPAPLQANVTLGPASFSPSSVTIRQTGTVTWTNSSTETHDLTFEAAGIADLDPFSPGVTTQRTFNAAGTFDYHCTKHAGMNGTVIVVP